MTGVKIRVTKNLITSNQLKQGDIIYVTLDPSMGYETKTNRPCIVVSNNFFNHHYNTAWVLPISSSAKYVNLPRYEHSPMFITINKRRTNRNDKNHRFIYGTVMVQHLRGIDPRQRCMYGTIANAKELLPQIRRCISASI